MVRIPKEKAMTVKIFIKRTITKNFEEELTILLHRMRSVCLQQPGYISGQTLKRLDKPGQRLVISTWRSLEDWENWVNSSERREIQLEIDSLLGEETTYAIYS
jgi:heme-degrading monooxygenase HmoA